MWSPAVEWIVSRRMEKIWKRDMKIWGLYNQQRGEWFSSLPCARFPLQCNVKNYSQSANHMRGAPNAADVSVSKLMSNRFSTWEDFPVQWYLYSLLPSPPSPPHSPTSVMFLLREFQRCLGYCSYPWAKSSSFFRTPQTAPRIEKRFCVFNLNK